MNGKRCFHCVYFVDDIVVLADFGEIHEPYIGYIYIY